MTDGEDRNARITREFREHGGKVGRPFANATIILLHNGLTAWYRSRGLVS